jgi:YggT family protein
VYAWNNLIVFIAQVLQQILTVYFWVVIIAAVMTWIEPNPYNPIVRFLYAATEPVFDWVREHLPVMLGGIDFSPVVVLFVIEFLQVWLIPTAIRALLYGFA